MTSKVDIDQSWLKHLEKEFEASYMKELRDFLKAELENNKIIYPPPPLIFEAFNQTPFDKVKVIILGQDPYHGPEQAHGLSFSVRPGVKPPPSLINIYKELEQDLGFKRPNHGFLLPWAHQGVFLLNTVLTVEQAKAGSHRQKGWERFTDKVIEKLNQNKEHLVFFLWGSPAQKKVSLLDEKKHLILKAPHPSPLSAHRGFFGQGHFSKANKFLKQKNLRPIDWSLPQEVSPSESEQL